MEVQTYAADQICREVRDAFDIGDSIHEDIMDTNHDDVVEEDECRDEQDPLDIDRDAGDHVPNFDARALEESLEHLFEDARSCKLATTVLLMNLCTVHGASNQCANELFSILHLHLLL